MKNIASKLKNFYGKHKKIINYILFFVISSIVITLCLMLYNSIFNPTNDGQKEKCGTIYCNKDETCETNCDREQFCRPKCEPGQNYYCELSQCANPCSSDEAFYQCQNGLKCLPKSPTSDQINVINENCNGWDDYVNNSNCKLYNPNDSTGSIYETCIETSKDSNYGKIKIGNGCGVPGTQKQGIPASFKGYSQKNIPDYGIITPDSTIKIPYNTQCGAPQKPTVKESFTLLKDPDTVDMATICKNTNNGFLNQDGTTDKINLPDKNYGFCGYDYSNSQCLVSIDCKDKNVGWNNYAYISGCEPDSSKPRTDSDYCSIPDYLYPETCTSTQTGKLCLPYGSDCDDIFDVNLSKIANACSYDSDGCINTIDPVTGNIIVYMYDTSSTKCKSNGQPDVVPSTTKGCRGSGGKYAWNGFTCFTQQTYPIITGIDSYKLINASGQIGINSLVLNIDSTIKVDLTNPTDMSLICYLINDDGTKSETNIFFDTSSFKNYYNFNNNQIIIKSSSAGGVVIASEDYSENNVNFKGITASSPQLKYYLGMTFIFNNDDNVIIVTSNDLNATDYKKSLNCFNY